MNKLVSLIATAVMVGTGVSTAVPTAGATAAPPVADGHHHHSHHYPWYMPPPIDWGECPTTSLQDAGAECGMLTVPLDYAHPRGTKIQLAVSRIEHTTPDSQAQGPMLVNPGGPGGSGLGLSRLGAFIPKDAGDPYDWIGFDPRGVGRSVPSLSCDGDYIAPGRPTYVPETHAIKSFWFAKTSAYARACGRAGGALLDHMRTIDSARDMDSLRKALGAHKINYYGFSYGTYLGQVYATLFPYRVRRFVFDGVVNPEDVWYDANLEQDKQFDKNIDTYFGWIAENDATYHLGTDARAVRQIYYDVLEQLTDQPDPNFGAADWNDVFVAAAYYVYGWDELAHVLVAAAHGDLGPAKEAYGDPTGPGADNGYAVYLAVECTDAPWPRDWSVWQRDNDRIYSYAPFLTWNNAWFNAPCRTWPARSGTPVEVNGRHVPPILLISETDDAATPFEGALEVRARFPRSVLIEGVGGTTHAGSLSGVACVDDRIADYLLTGALPQRKPGWHRSDVQCEPVPPPTPTPVAAARPSASRVTTDANLGRLRDRLVDAINLR